MTNRTLSTTANYSHFVSRYSFLVYRTIEGWNAWSLLASFTGPYCIMQGHSWNNFWKSNVRLCSHVFQTFYAYV